MVSRIYKKNDQLRKMFNECFLEKIGTEIVSKEVYDEVQKGVNLQSLCGLL